MHGQSFSGKIVGNVTDSTGGTVSTALVTEVNERTGAQRRLTTDKGGLYVASELPVGHYTMRFEAAGLRKVERLHVKVDVGGETRADAALSVQSIFSDGVAAGAIRVESAVLS